MKLPVELQHHNATIRKVSKDRRWPWLVLALLVTVLPIQGTAFSVLVFREKLVVFRIVRITRHTPNRRRHGSPESKHRGAVAKASNRSGDRPRSCPQPSDAVACPE